MSVAARERGTAVVLVTHEMPVGAYAGPKVMVCDSMLSSGPGAGP